jgi:ligand-binding SRPBCC domain-containing protein
MTDAGDSLSCRRFVDEQRHSPFARWWHEHNFAEGPDGITLMVDVIEFCSPLGRVADQLVLERYLRRLVQERNSWLKHELERRR